jgi:hypothetical protein
MEESRPLDQNSGQRQRPQGSRSIDSPRTAGDNRRRPMDWPAAVGSGLFCGVFLLFFPQGEPWAALTSFSPAVMGRSTEPYGWGGPGTTALHLGLAVVYSLIIASVVRHFRHWRGVLMGAAVGLGLYLVNFAAVRIFDPEWLGGEIRVAVTHALFGLFTAAIYKGMARRPEEKRGPPGTPDLAGTK